MWKSSITLALNTLRPRQNGRHFADETFNRIFLNENVRISIKLSLKFVPKGPIYNIPALVQMMTWRRAGDKPLSEPIMIILLTHICVTWPQWVNSIMGNRISVSKTAMKKLCGNASISINTLFNQFSFMTTIMIIDNRWKYGKCS